jgi:ABC-type glutathione transport system ATPase component
MALLDVRGLTKSYGPVTTVNDVSFSIAPGESLGLVGESGSGKTTIARMVLRLIEPTSGSVTFDGHDVLHCNAAELRQLRRDMQIVFQDPFGALNPRMRVAEIITEPLRIHSRVTRATCDSAARDLLRSVGLDASALTRFPHEFSGGQRQRINIARAIALRPRFLVLDEPMSALDVSVAAQIMNLLKQLQRDLGLTYLFISHAMPLVRYLCDRIAVLEHGRLVEIGPTNDVCDRPQNPYTQQLIAATPEIALPGAV